MFIPFTNPSSRVHLRNKAFKDLAELPAASIAKPFPINLLDLHDVRAPGSGLSIREKFQTQLAALDGQTEPTHDLGSIPIHAPSPASIMHSSTKSKNALSSIDQEDHILQTDLRGSDREGVDSLEGAVECP